MPTLSPQQLARGLELIERANRELFPNRRQKLLYLAFKYSLYGFVLSVLVFFLGLHSLSPADEAPVDLLLWLAGLTVGFLVLTFVLLAFSGRLLRKHWQLARMRRRVGLSAPLRQVLKRGLVSRLWRVAGVLFALLIVAFGLFWFLEDLPAGEIGSAAIGLGVMLFGLALLALLFLRRGQERIYALSALKKQLTLEIPPGAHEDGVEVPARLYKALTALEKDELLRSASTASSGSSSYRVQRTPELASAMSALEAPQRIEVEDAILQLAFHKDWLAQKSGAASFPVPGTDFRLKLAVDRQERTLRIVDLEFESASG